MPAESLFQIDASTCSQCAWQASFPSQVVLTNSSIFATLNSPETLAPLTDNSRSQVATKHYAKSVSKAPGPQQYAPAPRNEVNRPPMHENTQLPSFSVDGQVPIVSLVTQQLDTLANQLHWAIDATSEPKSKPPSLKRPLASETGIAHLLPAQDFGGWNWCPATNAFSCNEKWLQTFGKQGAASPTSIAQWAEYIHPHDRQRVVDELHAYGNGLSDSYICEYRILHPNGDTRWCWDFASKFTFGDADKTQHVVGVASDISETRRLKRELRNSEVNLRATLDSIGDAVIVTDARGQITRINPVAQQLTGWSEADALGHSFGEVFRTQNAMPSPVESIRLGLNSPQSDIELFLTSKDSTVRRISGSAASIRGDDRVTSGLVVVFRDVSEQHAVHQQLKHSEARFRTLVQTAPEAILLYNAETRSFTDVNKAGLALLGMTRDDVLRCGPEDIYPQFQSNGAESADLARTHLALAFEGQAPNFDCELIHVRSGRIVPCEIRLVRWPTEGKVLRCTIVDISSRKQAERRLRQSEQGLHTTLNSIGDAVIATDVSGKIVRMNPVAERMTGWTLAEAIRMPLKKVFRMVDGTTGESAPDPVALALSSKNAPEATRGLKLISRSGEAHHIASSSSLIKSGNNECYGVVLVFRDTNDEHLMQEKLRQSEKLQAIGQLAGGIAHDFNNMLSAIRSSGELLRMQLNCDQQLELVAMILQGTTRATELTTKMLAFARKGQMTTAQTDLHTLVEGSADFLARTIDRRIAIRLDLKAKETCVAADQAALESAILNIGINASHAMPQGGEIVFSSRNVTLDANQCDASPFDITPGEFCEISIQDTGTGISPSHLPKIFDPFFTTKRPGEGTGLGLSAVYGTTQDHNGMVDVRSTLEVGTTFRLLLPTTIVRADRSHLIPTPRISGGSGCILVVDDEEIVRTSAKLLLTSLGYEVHEACNGLEAVEYYKQSHEQIDAILLDVNMPVMDGHEAHRRIRKFAPDARIVIASGFMKSERIEEIDLVGPTTILRKPYSSNELCAALQSAVAVS